MGLNRADITPEDFAATQLSDPEGLLLVDDEENILKALVRIFRPDGYRVLTATSGEEGLEIMGSNPVAVVMSDMRMPSMNGVEFLNRVKDLYPDTIRIVLSGYTDLDTVTDAINQGSIYKFLTKPWDDHLLRENIRKAFRQYRLERHNTSLSSELNWMRSMFDSLPVAVIDVEDGETIRAVNSAAAELLGRTTPDMWQRPAEELPEPLRGLISDVAAEQRRKDLVFTAPDAGRVEARAAWYEGVAEGDRGAVVVTMSRTV